MKFSEQGITNLAPDLLKAQQEIPKVLKKATGQVGKQKTKYADRNDILDVVTPVLNANNIILLQPSKETLNGATIVTMLLHSSGEWISDDGFHAPSAGNGAQGVGSAATYSERYGLAALLGLSTQDDDGAAASVQQSAPVTPAQPVTRPAPSGAAEKLNKRIRALTEDARAQARDFIKAQGITWSNMTPAQLKIVTEWVHDAENQQGGAA